MKTKRPNRFQFWTVILLGYIILFVIGFFIPVAANAMGEVMHPDKQATTAKSTSSHEKTTHKTKKTVTAKQHHSAKKAVATTAMDETAEITTDTLDDATGTGVDQTTTNAATADTTVADDMASADAADASSAANATTVVVDRGVTAYSLARANGLTLAQLQALNPTIDLDGVQAGQILNVH